MWGLMLKESKSRLSLDVSQNVRAQIERLRAKHECSITEVIRRSIQLFETASQYRKTGAVLILRWSDNKETELLPL